MYTVGTEIGFLLVFRSRKEVETIAANLHDFAKLLKREERGAPHLVLLYSLDGMTRRRATEMLQKLHDAPMPREITISEMHDCDHVKRAQGL